ncbi:S1C family serine protease [Halosolutus gelatinilyticus]|uniref:S1C family serine protease n=1 Tax=Halosolutus gelatinilyticus TaxID=2931975 RepID=UPI001FF47B88|nr:trypsin-like peptidase domain-containing protein [Halosolutus gelatinilyticus]
MQRGSTSRRTLLKFGSIALATGLAGCNDRSPPADTSPGQADNRSTETRPQADGSVYTQVYRETISSVVLVRTSQGQGTGFLYDDAHVVTNAHVVGSARTTQLRFDDGTWSPGEVRGTDVHSDLAAIRLDSPPDSATPLSFAQNRPVIGQEVVAIGNPYNLDGTVTTGVVSGTDRLIPSPGEYLIPDAIQTDAAINPGNSGGPLMSVDGTVIGVVNSKRGDNIAFGISAALTQRVVPRLIERGDYEHAYMGASFEAITPTIAEANEVGDRRGLLVVETVDGGPADGPLRQSEGRLIDGNRVPVGGDILLAVDGTEVSSLEDVASYMSLETQPGDAVRLTVLRDGAERTVELTLESRPTRSRSPLR